MKIQHLSLNESLLNHFLSQLRDTSIQKDQMRFRRNLERIGEIMAYEISKKLDYKNNIITTPLGEKETLLLENLPVLCSILRAGLPFHQGFMNYFDASKNGFVAAYRHHPNQDDYFDILVEYQALPRLNNQELILIDPMLATGQSIVAVLNKIKSQFTPKSIHIAVIIAAPEGIEYLKKNLDQNVSLWIASIDEKLNDKNYIVPGLGDAGDLAFGEKL